MIAVVTVSRRIPASAERLFDAWLDPASLAVWMRRDGSEPSGVVADPRVGGSFAITMNDSGGSFVHTGRYVVIDRPRELMFTWRSIATHQEDSLVRISFLTDGDETVVEVRHEKLPDAEAVARHTEGWTEILDRFTRMFSENGVA